MVAGTGFSCGSRCWQERKKPCFPSGGAFSCLKSEAWAVAGQDLQDLSVATNFQSKNMTVLQARYMLRSKDMASYLYERYFPSSAPLHAWLSATFDVHDRVMQVSCATQSTKATVQPDWRLLSLPFRYYIWLNRDVCLLAWEAEGITRAALSNRKHFRRRGILLYWRVSKETNRSGIFSSSEIMQEPGPESSYSSNTSSKREILLLLM